MAKKKVVVVSTNPASVQVQVKAEVRRETAKMRKLVKETSEHIRKLATVVGERVPTSTRQGYTDGRKCGEHAITSLPYVVGAVVGFPIGLCAYLYNSTLEIGCGMLGCEVE